MDDHQKTILKQLESVPIEEVRQQMATKRWGDIGSPDHTFVSCWLSDRDRELRDETTFEALSIAKSADLTAKEALRIAKHEKTIAIIAAIVAIIGVIIIVAK